MVWSNTDVFFTADDRGIGVNSRTVWDQIEILDSVAYLFITETPTPEPSPTEIPTEVPAGASAQTTPTLVAPQPTATPLEDTTDPQELPAVPIVPVTDTPIVPTSVPTFEPIDSNLLVPAATQPPEWLDFLIIGTAGAGVILSLQLIVHLFRRARRRRE
jgi:hypothetical protein